MKSYNLRILFFFLAIFFAYANGDLEVRNVTVYLNGAQIEAEQKVVLKKGYNKIVVQNLPNDLLDESLQIKPMSASARLINVSTQYNALKTELLAKSQAEIKLEEVQNKLDLLYASKQILEGEEKVILDNSKIGNEEQGWSVDQLQKLSAFYSLRMNEIAKQKLSIHKETTELEKQKNDLLRQINSVDNSNRKEIVLGLESKVEATVILSIKYLVQNAGWVPKYELRATNMGEPIQLIYRASIFQNTGQDWKNVNISVSSYQPNPNQNTPNLLPLYAEIYKVEPIYESKMNNMALRKAEVRVMDAEELSEGVASAFSPLAEKQEAQFNVVYKISGNHSLLSGAEPSVLVINEEKLKAEYIYQTTPKMDERVFLLAKVTDWQTLDLINGEAMVYFNDQYVGKLFVDTKNTKESFDFSLGVDSRIVVERKKVDKFFTKKMLKSTVEEQFGYQIVLKNNTAKKVKIQVLDQIPISQDSRIKIEIGELSSALHNSITGSLTWELELEDKQKSWDFSYLVKYPKEENIFYSNR